MNIVIVVPTIRESSIIEFLQAWEGEFDSVEVIVVEDNPARTFELSGYANVSHYSWEDIDSDLGEDSWIIPRRTDCIRSYGYYQAHQRKPDMVVTLDDDCYPLARHAENGRGFLEQHWAKLREHAASEAWQLTANGIATRGVPYFNRTRIWPVALSHGMWEGVPDFDAATQLVQSREPTEFTFSDQVIGVGEYFPMCGMNVAFLPDIIPAFYFLLMGKDWPYDRFGDIWAGIAVKKICDHLGYAAVSGEPSISHRRASNVWANLQKEAAGLAVNEEYWAAVDRVVLTRSTFAGCYAELAESLALEGEYWTKLKEAMRTWAGLYDGG